MDILDSLFNHVVLPPVTPWQGRCRAVRDLVDTEFRARWDSVRRSLEVCKTVNLGGKLDKGSLLSELRGLQSDDILILHVAQQNAALLIRRHRDAQDKSVIFEAFEASPLSEEVLAAERASQWDFPGCAVCIPYEDFEISSFQDELAIFLEKVSRESINKLAAHTDKAGSSAYECRDTVDPSMITQMLMTLLEANGKHFSCPTPRKLVRDDLCWADGAEKPWRRCVIWLLLCVALQRHSCSIFGEIEGIGKLYG